MDEEIARFLDPYERHEIEEYADATFQPDKFYCLDGGFASSLQQFYDKDVDNDPLWSCRALKSDPEAVIKTHAAFVEAGANIITTNSYQGHHELFRKHIQDFADPIFGPHLLLEKSVDLVDEAIIRATNCGRNADRLVAGSVGPYGACQGDGSEYTGSYIKTMTRDKLCEWHKDRIKRLTFNNPVTIIAAETLPSFVEALAILDALKDFKGVRCWISFQCRDEATTAYGEPIEEAFRELASHPDFLKVKAVGVNCVKPNEVSSLLTKLNSVNNWRQWPKTEFYRKVPYVVYPNGGEDWDTVKKCWIGSNQDIISHVKEWMILGANAIGGCCRVGPRLVKEIKEEIIKNTFEVQKIRLEQSRKDRRPIDQWSYYEKKLKKPSYDEQKKRNAATKEFFRDGCEDGDASALVTAQIEAMMAQENKDIYEAIKKIEFREKIINDHNKEEDLNNDQEIDVDDIGN